MKDITVKSIPKGTEYKEVVIIGNGPSGITLSYMLAGNWPYWIPEKIEKHPDELLRARLNYADNSKSLVEQDLITLAEGLEGRSTNPVSLLLDSLEHPCADFGMELPSMLEYKMNSNRTIDHVVLGKGPPGGTWHRMDPNLRTLSLAAWMSLPGLNYNDWEEQKQQQEQQQEHIEDIENPNNSNNLFKTIIKNSLQKSDNQKQKTQMENNTECAKCLELRSKPNPKYIIKTNIVRKNEDDKNSLGLENNNESEIGALCCKCTKAFTINANANDSFNINQNKGIQMPPRRNLSLKRLMSKEVQTRALVSRVAQYYEEYVSIMDLNKYFVNDTIVTLIAPLVSCLQQDEQQICIPLTDQQDKETQPCIEKSEFPEKGKFNRARWIVAGINKATGRSFYYACHNVVLANGVSDLANRLGLRGETLKSSWVKHELPDLEADLEKLKEKERRSLKPVVVVGAGLSAADAVTICRLSDIPVIHVFRSRSAGLDKMLPENVYPEYHEVQRMMKDPHTQYDYYTPLPEHTLCDIFTSSSNNDQHNVTVRHLITGEMKTFEVSYCAILIGSRPDLRFISNITKTLPTYPSKVAITTLATNFVNQTEQVVFSPMSRKISWLKNFCSKCKHFNICEWSFRSNENRTKICGHQYNKTCDCLNRLNSPVLKNMLFVTEDTGLGLGIDPNKPIDSKTNQIAVDKFTNEIERVPKGLYALGPLVGDNFVRFIPGGALAITAALNREND
ncbi:oxidative stress-induced growth inhibitor 2-like [Condylostylus longicornis]|uniref:oxidative stress-induced growth inhibitor 2-like n=1 Tax=Condylostylus longicornis TaxID=2530218 RepID=UPI00244E10FB|nr:oxidative stress-induced growth inhibitor 2-like [Condylostylus longicornis]XP_055385769.1 oxidative stress-induced growth inhibitor 2-like [Condylostylus longicornis]